jgi:hypothetical protein
LSADTPTPPAPPPAEPPTGSTAATEAPPPPPTPPAPEQPNTALLVLKDKVQRYLTELVGTVEVAPDGALTLQVGSTRVFVRSLPWGEDKTTVGVSCPVLMGVKASPELFEHVATHSDDYLFGHLSAQRADDGTVTVTFTHTLLGDYLDPEELKVAVGAVVTTADQIDDDLKARFGGTRFHDDVA